MLRIIADARLVEFRLKFEFTLQSEQKLLAAESIFEEIIKFGTHSCEGQRAAYGEQAYLGKHLCELFDDYLSSTDKADEYWANFRAMYRPLEDDRFEQLVEKWRAPILN